MAKLKTTVRIVQTRYKTYALHFTNPDGRRRRLSIGPDGQIAQRHALRFTDWLLDGKDPERELEVARKQEQSQAITIREFFPEFMSRHGVQRSGSMRMSYRSSFKNVCRCHALANSELGKVSKKLVLDYMQMRMKQDRVTPATANREAAMLKVMLSCAAEWDIICQNPIRGLKQFKEAGKREVYLTCDQASTLLEELPSTVADIVEFAIYTGFRKENILSLRIEDITFHDVQPTGHVELTVKGNRREKFPLGSLAVEILKRAIGSRTEGIVFLNPRGTRYHSIDNSFNKAVRRLGLTVNGTKFRFHDLRHVFATWLHQEGVSLDAIRPLMGHADRATTDRYTSIDRLKAGNVLTVMPRIRKVC